MQYLALRVTYVNTKTTKPNKIVKATNTKQINTQKERITVYFTGLKRGIEGCIQRLQINSTSFDFLFIFYVPW